jgi:hypothetical protein
MIERAAKLPPSILVRNQIRIALLAGLAFQSGFDEQPRTILQKPIEGSSQMRVFDEVGFENKGGLIHFDHPFVGCLQYFRINGGCGIEHVIFDYVLTFAKHTEVG